MLEEKRVFIQAVWSSVGSSDGDWRALDREMKSHRNYGHWIQTVLGSNIGPAAYTLCHLSGPFFICKVEIMLSTLPDGCKDEKCLFCAWHIITCVLPGLGRSLREGNGNPLKYSCLENSMDGGAWVGYTVHRVAKSWTQLSYFTFFHFSVTKSCQTSWAVTRQAFLSIGFSMQEYWSELPFSPPGDPPDPGIELVSLASPWEMDWEVDFLPLSPLGSWRVESP